MEQNKVREFSVNVCKLLLELQAVHYGNDTGLPERSYTIEDNDGFICGIRGKENVYDAVWIWLRGSGSKKSIDPKLVWLVRKLADCIEDAVDDWFSVWDYCVTSDDIEEVLDADENVIAGMSRDAYREKYEAARDAIWEKRKLVFAGALEIAAQLRELANSVEQ